MHRAGFTSGLGQLGVLRRVFRVRGFMAAQQVRLGDVVALDFSRYGLAGGVLTNIVRNSRTGTPSRPIGASPSADGSA